jgi:hypothetical protein
MNEEPKSLADEWNDLQIWLEVRAKQLIHRTNEPELQDVIRYELDAFCKLPRPTTEEALGLVRQHLENVAQSWETTIVNRLRGNQ